MFTKTVFHQPDGSWNYAIWDNDLCAKCNEIDWAHIFSGSWHNEPIGGWGAGTVSPRSLAHIRDHQTCAFCRLTYHAMANAETWHDIEDSAVWLHHDVHAWVFSSPPRSPDRWPSRIEKRIWLRTQRGTEGIELTMKDGALSEPLFDSEKEVMMTRAPCIQMIAADPECTTGMNTDIADLMRRDHSDGEKNLFNDPNRFDPEELKILDRVHASACQGRWMPKGQVDYDMIQNWLWTCNLYHNRECTIPESLDLGPKNYPTRLIDVRRGCVVLTPPRAAYVCLSYVWGHESQLQLTAENLSTMQTEGALFDEAVGVAQTIKDAIYVCSMLGKDYLWVDSICIKQDDQSTRQAEIENMDIIYGGAELTIIAASGSHADAGLPGIRNDSRRVTQHVEMVRGRRLMASMPSPGYEANFSPWGSRAWTLQEHGLSHRRLFFTESQVYFQCRTTYFYEDLVSEIPGNVKVINFPDIKPPWASINQHDFDRTDGFPTYEDIVRVFTRRKLTFGSDALNACAGLFKVDEKRRSLLGQSTTFLFGLPYEIFTQALCWMAMRDPPGHRRSDFPSWSWAGWDTAASYDSLEFKVISSGDHYRENDSEATKTAALFEPRVAEEFDMRNPILKFWTTSANLRVDRSHRNPDLPQFFAIWSPRDPDLCLGYIGLSESARARRPDELEFIVIGVDFHENAWKHNNTNDRSKWERPEKYSYGVKLMCIEWNGEVAQRVQMTWPGRNRGPWVTTPSADFQSVANWKAVKPVEKLIALG